jgi:Zn-dependent metalloprotease
MNFRLTLLAASLALIASGQSLAQYPQHGPAMMSQTFSVSTTEQSSDLLSQLSAKHGLTSEFGFVVATEHPGADSAKVVRVNHTFQGVRVWGGESVLTVDAYNRILSESIAERRQGLLAATSVVLVKQLNMVPDLSDQEVIGRVANTLAPNGGTDLVKPRAELIIFPILNTVRVASAVNKPESELNAMDLETIVVGYELAYLVSTRMEVNGNQQLMDTIVSAVDGRTLKSINMMHTTVGVGHSQYNGQVPINTTFSNGVYSTLDTDRGVGGTFGGMAITNANHSGSNAGLPFTNPTNVWGDGLQYNGGSTTNANGQTAAVNAMWGLMNTYDTLNNVIGWKSLDGQNTATYIAVHANTNYDNAFYSSACKCMFIGDGGSYFNNLGSIDVIGHEMGHGITDATSRLVYSGESGGLNESNSDIVGEMVEAYARNGGTGNVIPAAGQDWFVGKEIAKNGIPLRYMQKPSKDSRSPDAWYSGISSIDVHYSSGPNNRMFYFLSSGSNATPGNDAHSTYLQRQPSAMTGIGNDKAFRIWFKSNTTKFTSSTNYADARAKMIESATELYGAGSAEVIAVKRAYAAINVGTDTDEIGYTSPVYVASQPTNFAVNVGGTATFSVTAEAGKAPYSYVWYKNGSRVRGVSGPTYSFVTTAADNGAKIFVRIADSNAIPGTTTSKQATLTVNPAGTTYERLVNGGFEQGATGWTGNTGNINRWTGQPPFEGAYSAWFGGNGSAITENLYQTVTIPANATVATLKFALHIDTAETTTTLANDVFKVQIRSTTGAVLATLGTFSNLNSTGNTTPRYTMRNFDVSAFKGQTVRVHFTETENSSLQTSFSVDSVSLSTD